MLKDIELNPKKRSESWTNRDRSSGGIKFFTGLPLPEPEEIKAKYKTLDPKLLRETHRVWRPEETLEAANLFFETGRINIVGSPQSGKGTILFGLSEICHAFKWAYLFIDGHHQDEPAKKILDAIREAEDKKIPVFFDNFDYLFAGSWKIRSISLSAQEERTPIIVESLAKAAVPVAITHHDEQWANLFLNKSIRDRFKFQIEKFPVYNIPDSFKSPESIHGFLIDQGVPPQEASFLANFAFSRPLLGRFKNLFPDSFETIFAAGANFPVLKEMVKYYPEEFLPLLTIVSQEGHIDDGVLVKFGNIILKANEMRINLAASRWNNSRKKH